LTDPNAPYGYSVPGKSAEKSFLGTGTKVNDWLWWNIGEGWDGRQLSSRGSREIHRYQGQLAYVLTAHVSDMDVFVQCSMMIYWLM